MLKGLTLKVIVKNIKEISGEGNKTSKCRQEGCDETTQLHSTILVNSCPSLDPNFLASKEVAILVQ